MSHKSGNHVLNMLVLQSVFVTTGCYFIVPVNAIKSGFDRVGSLQSELFLDTIFLDEC